MTEFFNKYSKTMYDVTIKSHLNLSWKKVVNQLSQEFIDEIFQMREMKSELKSKASAEILIYLDMLVVSKLNESFPVSTTVRVTKNNLEEIALSIDDSSVQYNDIVRMTSIRQEFYRAALIELSGEEDFLRTVGMQWFQFPFEEVDGSIRPSEFDFSFYFSDNSLVSEILFDLGPVYANKIVKKLEEQYSMMFLRGN